jgi:hypothetical protein
MYWALAWAGATGPIWGQTAVESWQYHAPFREAQRIAVLHDRVLVLSTHGLMSLELEGRVLTPYSTVEGLSGVGLSSLVASPDGKYALIGYEDGRIDRWSPNEVRTLDDVPRSGQFQGLTAIREWAFASPQRVFAAADFGLLELDLELNVVRGTYRMRSDSEPLKVYAVAVLGDSVFAATADGLKAAMLTAPLYLPGSWTATGPFADSVLTSLAVHQGQLAAVAGGQAYLRTATGWIPLATPSDGQAATRVCACAGSLAVVRQFGVVFFTPQGQGSGDISGGLFGNAGFTPRDIACGFTGQDGQAMRWIANPTRGITLVDNPNYAQHFAVNGPRISQSFDVRWDALRGTTVLTGAAEGPWTPLYLNGGLTRLPRPGATWTGTDGSSLGGAKDVLEVCTNPADSTHWFAASWGGGVLEFRNGSLYRRWTVGNTSLRAANGAGPNDVRCGGLVWGQDGALWVTNSLSDVPLHRYDPVNETWQGYTVGALNGQAIRQIQQAENGDFWVQTRTAGLVAVRVAAGVASARVLGSGTGNGNLPSPNIGAFAFTPDGKLWVGTSSGLGVLYSPKNAFTGGPFEAQQLLVEVDGRVQAVLAGQDITAIAVDGGNRKWIGTASAGVFVLSPDGLTQVAHYTTETSPLPTNRVNGLAMDLEEGYAYVATDRGLFALRSASTAPAARMTDALLFPNPYRPEFRGPWTVTGLVDGCYVKVTTADGRRVAEGYASGGQFVWDTQGSTGEPVPSGLYQFWINDPLGAQTTVVQGLLVRP